MAEHKAKVDDDADLVARAISELPYVTHAFQKLASRHYALVFRYCYNILRNHNEAEDTCQIIFLKTFHGLPRFQGRSSFKTWLLKIAANTCYSRGLKLKQERERFAQLDQEILEQVAETSHKDVQTLSGDRFENMIDGLSDQEQHLLGLRFVGELSLDEIAGIMGMGLSATKMRYYRALKKLNAKIDQ